MTATVNVRRASSGISGGPRSGAEGNRTPDLNSAIVALYQLSYSPGGDECIGASVQRRSQSSPCAAGPHEVGRCRIETRKYT